MLRFLMIIIMCSFYYSAAYAEEKLTLSNGKEILINPDGTWSYVSLGELQDGGIIDVDFYDYHFDPESYVGKTISLFGVASFSEYISEVRGRLYAEYIGGPSIQIETDGISKDQLKKVYKCFGSCKKKFIGKVVLIKTEYIASGYAQFNLIRIAD